MSLYAIPTASRGYSNLVSTACSSGSTPSFSICSTVNTTRSFLFGGNRQRIRQDGTITGARLYITDTYQANLTSLVFRAWRYNGATWDQVGSDSDTQSGPFVAGWNTFTFANPIIGVRAGDSLGLTAVGTDSVYVKTYESAAAQDYAMLWTNNVSVSGSGVTWGTTTANYSIWCEAYMQSPIFIGIGDSLMAGSPGMHSMLASYSTGDWKTFTPRSTIPGYLAEANSTLFTIAHHGIGSTTAHHWSPLGDDYLATYCTPYYPRAAIICLGINDVSYGYTLAQYSADIRAIAQTLLGNGTLPAFLTIPPWYVATAAQSVLLKSYNGWLREYCASINVPLIDAWALLGSAANPNIPNTASPDFYGDDGVHLSPTAYRAIANLAASQFVSQ